MLDAVRLGFQSEIPRESLDVGLSLGLSRSHRPTNVGFGLTYVLPVLTLVLSAAPGSLIMVENPEAHLHPQGQFEFARLIARAAAAGVQCLIETHSDHVVNGVRVAISEGVIEPTNVLINYFERSKRDFTSTLRTLAVDRRGRIDDWPEGFFDQYRLALMRLMGG